MTEWINNFEAFYSHIGPAPENSPEWSVGRIDNNGNYRAGNVRWELLDTQARNHSRQRIILQVSQVYILKQMKREMLLDCFWNDHNYAKQRKMFSVNRYGI